MTPDTADLVLKDLMVEPSLEFTLASRGGGNVHGGLTTTEDDVVLLGGDDSAIQRCIRGVCLENLEVPGSDELSGLVLGGRDEVSAVLRPLKVPDLTTHVMDLN